MIHIRLTDSKGEITGCGSSLPKDVEMEVYLALRQALIKYRETLAHFGDKK